MTDKELESRLSALQRDMGRMAEGMNATRGVAMSLDARVERYEDRLERMEEAIKSLIQLVTYRKRTRKKPNGHDMPIGRGLTQ